MRRDVTRRLVSGLLALALFVLSGTSARVSAQEGGRPNKPAASTPNGYSLEVFDPGSPGGGGGGGGSNCQWSRVGFDTDYQGPTGSDATVERQEVERVDSNGFGYRQDSGSLGELVLYRRVGNAGCPGGMVWVPTSLTARSLIPDLRARMDAILDAPVPNMSPAPDVGTYMNLGMWLAVEDPGVRSDVLSVGPVWASGRAVLTGFDVDFGNGHVESCVGVGVPIVDIDTFEEGPCGYTYEWPDKRGEFQVTFVSHYAVTYALSSGESGSLGVVNRSTSFPYHVYELVTTGVSN